jgi:putative transposase
VHPQTYYGRKKKLGGLSGDEVQRLRQMEQENGRLKRALADAMLDNQILRELNAKKLVGLPQKREAVARVKETWPKLSERRACELVGAPRTSLRYRPKGAGEAMRGQVRAVALEHPRYGHRRVALKLEEKLNRPVSRKRPVLAALTSTQWMRLGCSYPHQVLCGHIRA